MATDDVIDDLHGMSGAYALDALDPLERARYEVHLSTCAECREEVDGFRETAVLLAAAVAVEAPSVELRSRVLAGIDQVRPLAPTTPPTGHRSSEATRRLDAPPAAESDGTVVPMRRPVRRRWLAAGIAAAVAMIIGIGIGVVQPWHDQGGQQQVAEPLVQRIVTASDAQHSVQRVGGGQVEIIRSASVGRAVALFTGVRAPAGSRVYQLWLLRQVGAKAVSAGVVPTGRQTQAVLLQGSAAQAQAAAISREPAGGSPEPTTRPVVFTFNQA